MRLICFFLVAVLSSIAQASSDAKNESYVTWTGIGPDKWASAWLIHRHIDPGANILVIDTGEKLKSGIAFDIPEIPPYIRDSKQTTYESLIKGFSVQRASLIEVAGIIHDIEVNFWGGKQSIAAPFVEKAFRSLQFKYGRESVPQNCYFQLFDALQGYIEENPKGIQISSLEQALAHDARCGSVKHITVESDKKYVSEWKPEQILAFIGAGDKVVFIDTRETDEFEEGHIPGAINIKLRDIDDQLPAELKDADVVVPYCVKDFRGFEVAKKLKELGAKKVGLMNPWGISGWKAAGLPVAGTRGLEGQEAILKFRRCVDQPKQCIKDV